MQMSEAGIDLPRVITSFSELLNMVTNPCEEKNICKEVATEEVKLQQKTTFTSFSILPFNFSFILNSTSIEINRVRLR